MMVVLELLPRKTLTTHDAAAPSMAPQTRGGGGGDGRGVRVVGVGGDAGPAWPQGKLFVEVTWKAQVAFPRAVAFPVPLGPYSTWGLPPRGSLPTDPPEAGAAANGHQGHGRHRHSKDGRGGIFSFLPWAGRELGFERGHLPALRPGPPPQ